jgi:hypothetical protein
MMTETEAIERAMAEVKQLGWHWSEPIGAHLVGQNWVIRTNYLGKGSYVEIILDSNTKEVVETRDVNTR